MNDKRLIDEHGNRGSPISKMQAFLIYGMMIVALAIWVVAALLVFGVL